MINNKPLKIISTRVLVSIAFTVNFISLSANAVETATENTAINSVEENQVEHKHHHPDNKSMDGIHNHMQMDSQGMVKTATENAAINNAVENQVDHKHHHPDNKSMEGMHNHMQMDNKGMVMYANKDNLPKGCNEISEEVTIQVTAGTKFAEEFPGTVFGYDKHQWQVKPCSRITVEFTNDDEIRHQWMIHGLPKYIYPEGMFHIELFSKGTKTGTFIVPNSHYTYLVHCDIAQHTEKGMKAQLVVGNGREDLSSIPGISDPKYPERFPNNKKTP